MRRPAPSNVALLGALCSLLGARCAQPGSSHDDAGGEGGVAGEGGAGGSAATGGATGTGGGGGRGGAGGATAAGGTTGTGGAGGVGGAGGRGGASGAGGAGSGGASGGGGLGGTGGAGGARVTWDWTGIVGTGQSLSVGEQAPVVSATTQPYHNLKLSLGTATVPPFSPTNTMLTMVPLVEPIRRFANSYPSAYPANLYGETPHTAMGSEITALYQVAFGGDYVTVHTVVGESGQPMTVIQKGATDTGTTGRAYAATLFEAAAIARLAGTAGKTYGIGAIVITHGEADAGSATYENDLVRLWSDYNADLMPLTGQTARIAMLVSQQQSTPSGMGQRSASLLAEWKVGVDHPGDIICTGPKYQYAYSTGDGAHTHLTTREYERLGEKYAEVFFQKVVMGRDWQPLQPTAASRNGRVITVTFHVPSPPLVFDTAVTPPHQSVLTEWAAGRGFEVRAGNGTVGIASVAISGSAVQITTAADLPATGVVVGYASTADGAPLPTGTARWGLLRDSDPFVGATTGSAQPNYAVSFELPVP